MTSIRPARAEDARAIAEMLARAFETDPIARYLFPEEFRRSSRLARFFELQLRHSYLPRGEVLVYEDYSSASLVLGPTSPPPRLRDQLATFELVWLLGSRVGESRQLAHRLAERHPREPHYYLGTIGTDPLMQRQGRARGLLDRLVTRCDEEQRLCCLEASKAENVGLYRRFGFEVHDELLLGAGAPPIWLMRREPRPSGPDGSL